MSNRLPDLPEGTPVEIRVRPGIRARKGVVKGRRMVDTTLHNYPRVVVEVDGKEKSYLRSQLRVIDKKEEPSSERLASD